MSVSLRSASSSHGNIIARKAFTIGLPGDGHTAQADHFGIVSRRDQDKFRVGGLTPVHSDVVDAPCDGEFPFVLEGRLTWEEALQVAVMLEKATVDVIEVYGRTVVSRPEFMTPRPGLLKTAESDVCHREAARLSKQ